MAKHYRFFIDLPSEAGITPTGVGVEFVPVGIRGSFGAIYELTFEELGRLVSENCQPINQAEVEAQLNAELGGEDAEVDDRE